MSRQNCGLGNILIRFKIKKTSKKGNTRQVDLRPQLLGLEYMDQTAVDAALKGKHIPIPPTPQPGTALLRFKGEYTGAGGLSVPPRGHLPRRAHAP